MADVHHRDEVIKVSELPFGSSTFPMLHDHHFTKCVIQGPGVLILTNQVGVARCDLSANSLWPIERNRGYVGGIGVERCSFEQCQFEGVGIAAPPDVLALFTQ